MTFLEAALEILKREGRPLHFKELTERAMTKKLLTFVGRTPELSMQTQLTAAIKKNPGNPFVRVKPGTFGLLRYPEVPPEDAVKETPPPREEPVAPRPSAATGKPAAEKSSSRASERRKEEKRLPAAGGLSNAADANADADGERGRRRRRRGGRGVRAGKEGASESEETTSTLGPRAEVAAEAATVAGAPKEAAAAGATQRSRGAAARAAEARASDETFLNERSHREGAADHPDEHMDEHEPPAGGLSAEARAAALAETGVLEGDDQAHEDDDDNGDDEDDEIEADVEVREPSHDRDARDAGHGRAHGRGDDDADELAASFDGPARGSVSGDETGGPAVESGRATPAPAAASDEGEGEADDGDDETEDDAEGSAFGEKAAGDASGGDLGEDPARRRRRRRRRRRGPNGDGAAGVEERGFGANAGAAASASPSASVNVPAIEAEGGGAPSPLSTSEGASALAPALAGQSAGSGSGSAPVPATGGASVAVDGVTDANGQSARKILAPIDAAIEVLRSQPPGRGVHVRQIADSAIRKRMIHGEPNEAWRVVRTALATESKHRLRNGMRPRVRSAGSGLFALARRPPEPELEKAEHVFGEARRALRERTMAALEKRLAELPPGAFEALARVLLQREGFGPTTFVKRVDGTIYVEALRGRGSRPSRCLIALRAGGTSAGRRTIGELRAGIRARNQDEGVLMLCGRLADDGITEWKQPGPPLEIVDGAALAETCARHGVGVQTATVVVDFVDGDFFAELSEG